MRSASHRAERFAIALGLAVGLTGPAAGQCGVPASIGGSGGVCRGLDVEGHWAFGVEHGRLTTFDVTDPTSPCAVGTVFLGGNFLWDVKVSDGIAACADAFWGVRLVDVHDPRAPFYLSTLDTPYGPESVAISSGFVYAADGQSSVRVIDVTTPTAPVLVASLPIYHSVSGWYVQEVELVGSKLYVGSEAYKRVALDVFDVSNPTSPVNLGGWDLTYSSSVPSVGVGDLQVSGTTVYLSDTAFGLHVLDASVPSAVTKIGSLPSTSARAMKVMGSQLLMGRWDNGVDYLDVVDVTNPAAPIVLATVTLPGQSDDIAVVGNHALVGMWNAGIATLDLSVPSAPVVAALSRTPDQASDVAVSGGVAYVADGAAGLKVMDLSNPMVPRPIGQLDTPGSATGISVVGTRAYIADASSGLQIVDVGVPTSPVALGALDTPGSAVEVAVSGNLAYIADGGGGFVIADVSNPAAPSSLGSLPFGGVNAFATSVFVAGNLAYLTDTYYGLRIVDVTNPASPFLRSTTDTYSYAGDVIVNGPYAYVVDYSRRVYVMDVSNPDAPVVVWNGPINSSAKKIALVGNTIYLSQNQGGYMESYDVGVPWAPVKLPTVWAPTGGGGIGYENGILVVAHRANGLQTFRADGLPFIAPPAPVTVCAGADATLRVAAAGQTVSGAYALAYQWRRNGVDLTDGPTQSGSTIRGSDTAALQVLSVTNADADTYDCVVTNSCGPQTSAGTTLGVAGPGCVTIYCTAKSGLTCGRPSIAFTGSPSAGASSGFVISAAPARGSRLGILAYTDRGRAALPFHGGLLCVKQPKRSIPAQSGGTPGQCDGAFSLDLNAFAGGLLGGNPDPFLLSPGTQVDVQWWGRDSAATDSFLSEALEYTVVP